jgi:two-component system OmpR family response regulator
MMQDEEGRMRVVIVEDDPDYRSIVYEWLSPYYDTICLEDGEDLLDDPDSLAPDFIIMDINLPGEDGVHLCRRLRRDRRFRGTPILFLTGVRSDKVFLKSMEMGGDAYLTKPVERRELLQVIRDIQSGANLRQVG